MRNILPASLEIQKLECKGLMCGVPLFIPILQFLKLVKIAANALSFSLLFRNFWYVPIEEKLPQNLPSTSLEQVSAVLSPSGSKTNFTFEANCMLIYLNFLVQLGWIFSVLPTHSCIPNNYYVTKLCIYAGIGNLHPNSCFCCFPSLEPLLVDTPE